MIGDDSTSGDFLVAVGNDAGQPVTFRVRNRFPTTLEPAKYTHLIAIFWKYEPINGTGIPAPDLHQAMNEFEDVLTSSLQTPGQAIMTAVVTGTGVREWQWYSRDPDETLALLNAALEGKEIPPVEFAGDPDPTWESYKRALSIVEEIATATVK